MVTLRENNQQNTKQLNRFYNEPVRLNSAHMSIIAGPIYNQK